MKKCKLYLFIIIFISIFSYKNIYAYDVNNYKNRNLCDKYEVAGFHTDGVIDTVGCYKDYETAKSEMKKNGANDLALMTKVNGKTKIIDANMALLDLTVNPNDLTYYYENSELTSRQYTYMYNGSLYGGVDGAILDSAYSNSKSKWVAKVRISGFTGWIPQEAYEVVPITWINSTSSYTVTSESIRHNYITKLQNNYSGNSGCIIGPKPDMLKEGRYYSYDGHYFYNNIETLIKDYRNDNYNNSVNKNNPYYNYYMYLSVHTKSNYSSLNIDEYIRNNLGYRMDVYGDNAESGTSRLYGMGQFIYWTQQRYGINALITLAHGINESGFGRSSIAVNKNNGFGLNAVDSSPSQSADAYGTYASGIETFAKHWMNWGYAKPEDSRYFGPAFGDKHIGMNVKYASAPYWSESMATHYYAFDKAKGMQDYNYYQLGIVTAPVDAKTGTTLNSKTIYHYPEADDGLVVVGETTGESVNGNNKWYEIVSDRSIDNNYNYTDKDYGYNWGKTVYVPAVYVKLINTPKSGTYKTPQSVPKYQDAGYQYDLLSPNQVHQPKIGITLRKTGYQRDASLTIWAGLSAEANRILLIHAIAYDKNNKTIAYLVTSDYQYQQKHWVAAKDVEIIDGAVGKLDIAYNPNISIPVHETTSTGSKTIIGLYDYSYVPIIEEKVVDGKKWYKIPTDVDGTKQQYGWILTTEQYCSWAIQGDIASSTQPIINASDRTITQGLNYDQMSGVTAKDYKGNDITSSIKIKSNNVDINKVGTYTITYEVTANNRTSTKSIKATVKENAKPVITASDIELEENGQLTHNYSATDTEDGDLTNKVTIDTSKVNTTKAGIYDCIYSVKDNYNQETKKTVKVYVLSTGPSIRYTTQVQDYGWLRTSENGQMSGTSGESKRLEAIKIQLVHMNYEGSVEYRTHIQDIGWEEEWKSNYDLSGTVHQSKRLESIEIRLTGEVSKHYDIYYRVHAEKYGWMDWASNGSLAGTSGLSKRLEGIEIVLVEKGQNPPEVECRTDKSFITKGVSYTTHVQDIGWQDYVNDGDQAGTDHQSKRLEAIKIKLTDQKYSGSIEYKTHIQDKGWEKDWKKDNELSGTSGQSKRLEAIEIKLNGEMANNYDIYYRVHAENFGWMGWASNGKSAGTAHYSYRLEAIQIILIPKGHLGPSDNKEAFIDKNVQ